MSERDEVIANLNEEFVSRSLQGETLPEICGFIADAILLVRGMNDRLRAELADYKEVLAAERAERRNVSAELAAEKARELPNVEQRIAGYEWLERNLEDSKHDLHFVAACVYRTMRFAAIRASNAAPPHVEPSAAESESARLHTELSQEIGDPLTATEARMLELARIGRSGKASIGDIYALLDVIEQEFGGTKMTQYETKHYSDGTSAFGVTPLPNLSPDQQDRMTTLAKEIREGYDGGWAIEKRAYELAGILLKAFGGGKRIEAVRSAVAFTDDPFNEAIASYEDAAKYILAAADAAAREAGWVLVPVVPTTKMRVAGGDVLSPVSVDFADEIWRRMLAAARSEGE